MPEDAKNYMLREFRKASHRVFFGCEVKPYHMSLTGHTAESFINMAKSVGFTHFVILDRKNRLRKIVSSVIAHRNTELFHFYGKKQAKLEKVEIDTEDVKIDFASKPLIKYLEDFDQQIQDIHSVLAGSNVLNISYEEDIEGDPHIAYNRICDFLNIDRQQVSVKLSRTNPFPVADMIENIDEVRSALQDTRYEWMLKD